MSSDILNLGPALGQRPTAMRPIIVKRNVFDCWEVQGLCSCKDGYPVAKIKAQWDRVYRFTYRKFKGPIDAGLCVTSVTIDFV